MSELSSNETLRIMSSWNTLKSRLSRNPDDNATKKDITALYYEAVEKLQATSALRMSIEALYNQATTGPEEK